MKTFTTLTIRNLDQPENTNIVKIMNDIITRFGVSTGQAIFEKAIYQYDNLNRRLSDANISFNETVNRKDALIQELKDEVLKYKAFYESHEAMQEVFTNIQKSKKVKK